MHVVAINVTLNDPEGARDYLQSDIVPNVKQAPGFVAGYWYGDEAQRRVYRQITLLRPNGRNREEQDRRQDDVAAPPGRIGHHRRKQA